MSEEWKSFGLFLYTSALSSDRREDSSLSKAGIAMALVHCGIKMNRKLSTALAFESVSEISVEKHVDTGNTGP